MSTPTELMERSKCYAALTPGFWPLLKLGLLQQILLSLDAMADTSVNALLEAAKCYACHPPGFWQLFEQGLLAQIAETGIGTGTGGVLCGAADPTTAPDNTCAIYYRTDTGGVWIWTGAAWTQIIA